MAKIDLRTLPVVTVQIKTFHVTDQAGTDYPFTFGFSETPSQLERSAIQDRAANLIDRYVTRNTPLLTGTGARVPVSESACYNVSTFIAAEELTGSLDTNTAEDLFMFAFACPGAYRELSEQFIKAQLDALGIDPGEVATDDADDAPVKNA